MCALFTVDSLSYVWWCDLWVELTWLLWSLSLFSSLFTVSCQNNMLFFSYNGNICIYLSWWRKARFVIKLFQSTSKHSTLKSHTPFTLFSSHETRQLLTWLPQLWAHTKKYKAHYELLCDAIMLLWANTVYGCVCLKNE